MRFLLNWINAHQDALALVVVCMIVVILHFMKEKQRKVAYSSMGPYTIFVLYKTVLSRKPGVTEINLKLGWTYKALIQSVPGMFSQIYLNIMLFVPIGIFGGILFLNKKKRSWLLPVGLGVILTMVIEYLQLSLHCGTFELDDILNNTIGTITGVLIADRINRVQVEKE